MNRIQELNVDKIFMPNDKVYYVRQDFTKKWYIFEGIIQETIISFGYINTRIHYVLSTNLHIDYDCVFKTKKQAERGIERYSEAQDE
jgi:hypothetical protein